MATYPMLYFGDGTIGNLIKDYGTYMNAEGKDVYRMIILLSPEAQNRYGLDINSSGVNDKGLLGGPYFEMDYPELHVHELQMMEDNLWVREIDVNPIGGETKKSQRHQLLKDTITIQKNEMRRYRTSMKVQLNKLEKQKVDMHTYIKDEIMPVLEAINSQKKRELETDDEENN